jgi:Ca2+-binding RTX toxin-like protein
VDVLTGGSGADTFGFYADGDLETEYGTDSGVGVGNRDIISDFSQGQDDVIDVGDIGDLDFIGQAAFSSVTQVRYFHSGGDTIVQVNHIGVSGADLEIELHGIINLMGSDFIL